MNKRSEANRAKANLRWEKHRAKMREFERLKKEAEQHQANLDHWKKKVEIANKIADELGKEVLGLRKVSSEFSRTLDQCLNESKKLKSVCEDWRERYIQEEGNTRELTTENNTLTRSLFTAKSENNRLKVGFLLLAVLAMLQGILFMVYDLI